MVIQNNTRRIFCLLWGLLGCQWAAIAASEDTVIELAPFQVHEKRMVDGFMESAVVEQLNYTDTQGGESTLGALLSQEVGISSSAYGAGASRPIIRGMEGYRVGVLDGGFSTGDLSASSPDHAVAIEPLFIESIKIDRGVAALKYGGSAIGGAVDITPNYLPNREMPNGLRTEVGGHYETVNDGRMGYLKTGYKKEAFAYRANVLIRDTGDYNIPGFARTPDYDTNNRIRLPPDVQGKVGPNPFGSVPNTWTRTRVAGIGLGWFGNKASHTIAFQHYHSHYGVPTDGHTHGNPAGVFGVSGPSPADRVTIELTQNRFTGETDWQPDTLLIEGVRLKWAASSYTQTEWEGRFLTNDFSSDNGLAVVEVAALPEFGSLLFGLSGGANDYQNTNFSYYTGRTDWDNLESATLQAAFYAISEIRYDEMELYFGMRGDMQSAKRRDFAGLERNDVAPTLVAEVRRHFTKSLRGVLIISRTSRIPNAEEFYIEAPHGATGAYLIPNPSLKIETANSAEARLEINRGIFSGHATAFIRSFDDFIYLENQGYEVDGLTAYAYVQTAAEFAGWEIKGSLLFFQNSETSLRLTLFSDYVRATDRDQDEPLPRIPPLRAGGELSWEWGRWRSALQVVHAFSQGRVPREVFGTLAYQSPSAAYTEVSVGLECEMLLRDFTLKGGLRIKNLLDEEIRQHTSFLKDVAPLAGRSLQIYCSLNW